MIAISSSGTLLPPKSSANTCWDSATVRWSTPRTVMYEIRKLPKMNVSLSRKIHIIGLPQGTPLNARWSDEKSATTLLQPLGLEAACRAGGLIGHRFRSPLLWTHSNLYHNGTAGVQIERPR